MWLTSFLLLFTAWFIFLCQWIYFGSLKCHPFQLYPICCDEQEMIPKKQSGKVEMDQKLCNSVKPQGSLMKQEICM